MVFTPEADGVYTLIIGNQGCGAGKRAVYLFDEATDTPIATITVARHWLPGKVKLQCAV
ncbi:MAG: hypothetical protein H6661_12525 [Ardenticatenaceae bacterium]|nr:hypothetical protein [Ardenticatenaceae bacterium]